MSRSLRSRPASMLAAAWLLFACGGENSPSPTHADASGRDAAPDAGTSLDAAPLADAAPTDAMSADAMPADAGEPPDAVGPTDAAPLDAGRRDAAALDVFFQDSATRDATAPDSTTFDAAPLDGTAGDLGPRDSGALDAAPRDGARGDVASPDAALRDGAVQDAVPGDGSSGDAGGPMCRFDGTYAVELGGMESYFRFNPDGTWVAATTRMGLDTMPKVHGVYSYGAGIVRILDVSPTGCSQMDQGVYRVTFTPGCNAFTLTVIMDPCGVRSAVLNGAVFQM